MTFGFGNLLLSSLLSFIPALLLVPAVARIMKRCGIVDRPSARRINTRTVPRGGGIGVAAAFALGLWACRAFLGIDPFESCSPVQCRGIFAAAAAILALGIWDDARNLNPFAKLAGQALSSAMLFFSDVSVGSVLSFGIPPWLDFLCTVAWCVIAINAMNLIDGIDGLCAGIAAIGILGMGFCYFVMGIYSAVFPFAVLGGAVLGFLVYNFNPASVFLGDSGSMFLGLMVAAMPLAYSGKTVFVATMGLPVLVLGVPIMDMCLAAVRRMLKSLLSGSFLIKDVVKPDTEHLHHRLLKAGLSQRQAAVMLYCASLLFVLGCVALVVAERSIADGVIVICGIAVFALLGKSVLRTELLYGGRLIANVLLHHRPGRFFVAKMALALFADAALWCISWYWAAEMVYIPHVGLRGLHYNDAFLILLFAMTAVFFLCRIYLRVWQRAHLRDYAVLLAAVLGGCVIAFSLINITQCGYLNVARHVAAFFFIAVFFSVVLRLSERILRQAIAFTENSAGKDSAQSQKAVLYGSKERFAMLDLVFSGSRLAGSRYCIVGIVDDDPAIWNMYVHGYRCYGGIGALEGLIAKSGAKTVILCALIAPERMEILRELAQRTGLEVLEFNHRLAPLGDGRKGAE